MDASSGVLTCFCFCHATGAGLVKLRDDVQTCEYEDVQVMWEMLQKTETQVLHNKRPFWRVFVWSNSSQSSNHTS